MSVEEYKHETGCGHDHHGHGHGHHHDHACQSGKIKIGRHEEALIGSMQGSLPCRDFQQAQTILAGEMRKIGEKICTQGGIIGHIKFILSGPSHCCQLSLTDTTESVRYFDNDCCGVEGVVIVFNVTEAVLHKILEETLGAVLEETET